MPRKECFVDFNTLERFITGAFRAAGVPEVDAEICADVLISADKHGIDTHGIARLKLIYLDRIRSGQINPKAEMKMIREGKTSAVIDAQNGMGQVVSKKAMRIAMDKAKQFGMGMAVVRNSNHYGIAGYYVRMAAEAGLIGITGTNARPSVAPTFGVEPMLGTNPLAFGMPTDEPFPFILDCATSAVQRGKIELLAARNKPVPKSLVIGADGRQRSDSKKILVDLIQGKAALLPIGGAGEETGGHKGYGYATVVEILSSALAGGAFLTGLNGLGPDKKTVPYGFGHFFIAVDVSTFTDPESFRKTTGDILRALRASRRAPGKKRIFTAGEKEYVAWMERKEKGLKLDAVLQKEILGLKKLYQLNQFRFSFEK